MGVSDSVEVWRQEAHGVEHAAQKGVDHGEVWGLAGPCPATGGRFLGPWFAAVGAGLRDNLGRVRTV